MDTAQRETFGAALKRHRLAAGLSQEQLAERAGMTAQAIGTLERGFRRAPYRDTVRALARALDLDPAGTAALEAAVARGRADAAGAADAARPTLPAPPSPLIGREREAGEVAALLHRTPEEGPVRLLTLTGPGGVGKTRLALELARLAAPRYADGVVFVALAPLRDPDLVAAAIAQALRVKEGGRRSLQEALRAHLLEKRLLLLLDNFEQVAAAAPVVADLLARCPGLRVLATSRARLRVGGEQVYPVPPLRTPDPAHLPGLPELAAVPAVALLVQRARAAAPDFALDEANAPAVAALCARLDGLPLALELAAPRLAVLSPGLLLRRLTSRLHLLTGGARDLPERQQTLRATLDWSYALLGPGEQAALRRLSVFAGGCTLEAAEAVWAVGGMEAADVPSAPRETADLLGALIDASLLRREAWAGEEPRFVLLETVREYGLEALAAAGEAGQVGREHALHYLALAEEAETGLLGPEQVAWGARLEAEHDNLRAALAWATGAGDAHTGQRLAGALWRFWSARGHLSEGRRWLREVLALGDGVGVGSTPPCTRAKALTGAAMLARGQTGYDEAEALCAEAVALAMAAGGRGALVGGLNAQGLLATSRGRYEEGARLHDEAVARARAGGDRAGVAAALAGLGSTLSLAGDAGRCRLVLEESMSLFRELGDLRGLAEVLNVLARGAGNTGSHEQVVALASEALALFRTLDDTGNAAESLFCLGIAAQMQGHYARAEPSLEECLALRRARGDERGAAAALSVLGGNALRREDVGRAIALLTESLAMIRRHDDPWGHALHLALLGHAELAAGSVEGARARFAESAGLLRAIGNPWYLPWSLDGLAGVAAAEVQPRLAARLCGAGDALRERLGSALPSVYPAGHARTLAAARAAMGDEAFAAAREEGRALAPEGVIAEALAAVPVDSGGAGPAG